MKRRVILCGAGHTHLHVASRAREFEQRDTELLVIDPGTFWYSGMATGLLGGRYNRNQDCIDVARLVRASGGTHVPDRVALIDPGQKMLRTAGGQQFEYDLISLNIGSQVAPVPAGAIDPEVWPVKPISNLLDLHQQLSNTIEAGVQAPECLVLGGGSTGCEAAGNLSALFMRHGVAPKVKLVSAGTRLCAHLPGRASRVIENALIRRGVRLDFKQRITGISNHTALAESGERLCFDHLVLATGLGANQVEIGTIDSPQASDPDGFEVDGNLQSTRYPDLFASGDCARMRGYQLPKIGVFCVRQAPVLHRNLLARLDGEPMQTYTPQETYLSILNLGNSEALAVRGKFWWFGRSSMWLKEWLDRRFVEGYQAISESGR